MPCNEDSFNKYPYVYSCCPESIDGITEQFLIDLYKDNEDIIGFHLPCCACGKIYHLFKLGMKWTEQILTREQLVKFKEIHDKYIMNFLEQEKKISINKKLFTLADIPKFICKVCKQEMFKNESLEIKEMFVVDLNIKLALARTIGLNPTIEEYIQTYLETGISNCRDCYDRAKKREESGKYN